MSAFDTGRGIRLSQAGSKERKTSIRFPIFFTKKTEDDESADSRDTADRESASPRTCCPVSIRKYITDNRRCLSSLKRHPGTVWCIGFGIIRHFRSSLECIARFCYELFSWGKTRNALLFGYAMERRRQVWQTAFRFVQPLKKKENLSLVPLAAVSLNADPDQKDDTTLFDIDGVSPQNQIVLSSQAGGHLAMAKDPEEDGGVKIYTVSSATL